MARPCTGICDITADYVSAPFRKDRLDLYKDSDNADRFFRPALRSLLVSEYLFTYYISAVV